MSFEFSEANKLKYKIKNLEHQIEQLHLQLDETPTIKTNDGKVKGVKRRTIYDDIYYSFERIPYALPPVGELRFRAPKPMSPWKGVRDCTHNGPKPVQADIISGNLVGAEDCLFVNVYTNSLNSTKPRPVMVFIYGGGFSVGEATREWYAPDFFMKKDVVLVTVQYRLGSLGFLSLNEPSLHTPGNAGLKDQLLALKWVKRNCASFGGDPECITLFGESAGAVSVHALMLSEQARGLFQRAILQSGAITAGWLAPTVSEYAVALAQAAGYTGEPKERLVHKYLLNCTAEELFDAEKKSQLAFVPAVEPYVTQHTLLAKPFADLLGNAWGNDIPVIIGATSSEGVFFVYLFKYLEGLMETCETFVPKDAVADHDGAEAKEKGLKLRKLHVSGETATAAEFCDILSFAYFWHPLQKAIDSRLQKHTKKAPTYLYRFDFDSEKLTQLFHQLRGDYDVSGVGHADDLSYLFHTAMGRRMEQQSREYRTIERMIGLWTTFAQTGNPNAGKIYGMKGIKWQPLQPKTVANASAAAWKCLNIGDELKFMDLPEMPKLRVWQELYDGVPPQSATGHVNSGVHAKAAL